MALFAGACIPRAHAMPNTSKLVCSITDSQGSLITYVFNEDSADTMLEASFRKNGKTTVSDAFPVWNTTPTTGGGMIIASTEANDWFIAVSSNGGAVLKKKDHLAGAGLCVASN
jgi:hypothetical protein